jgi:hypothetical protein
VSPDQGRPAQLWQPADVVLLYGLNLLGIALVLASAWATTATDDMSTRVAWVNLGVVGVLVAGVGNTFWLMTGRRAVGERRARLLAVPASTGGPSVNGDGPERVQLVALQGGSRFHRQTCPLVDGKSVVVSSRARHEREGLAPCGVCEP